MIIEEINIVSFGKLKNKVIHLNNSFNIICGDNESGKTTIANFIYAILYGFGDNRGKELSLREKYRPWDGGECEGSITLCDNNGKKFTVYRKSGASKKYDVLKVFDSLSGNEISITPAELVGVTESTFFKTLYVKQLSTSVSGSNDEIISKLSNLCKTGDDAVNISKAERILTQLKRRIYTTHGGGELSEINDKLPFLTEKYENEKKAIYELQKTKAEILDLKTELSKIPETVDDTIQSELALAIKSKEETHEKTVSKKRPLQIASKISFICAVVFFLLSFMFKISFVFFVIFSLFSVYMLFTASKNNPEESLLKEIEKLKSQLLSVQERQLSSYEKKSDLKGKILSLEAKAEFLKNQLADGPSESEISELVKRKEVLFSSLKAIDAASRALKSVQHNLSFDFTPQLNGAASKYFSYITEGKYNSILSDKDFNISVGLNIPYESSFFSGGTIDQLYLSLRLALSDMIFNDKSTFIILDQPFIQYDEKRFLNAISLLKRLSVNRQFIIFSANKNNISDINITEMLT